MWVDYSAAPLVDGERLTLALGVGRPEPVTGPARVSAVGTATASLDLGESPYVAARLTRDDPLQLLRLTGGGSLLLATSSVGASSRRDRTRVDVAIPDGWQLLTRRPRAPVTVPLDGAVVHGGTAGRRFEGETDDLSEGGTRFRTGTPPPRGATVALRLHLPDGPPAPALGEVVDVEPPHLGGPPHYVVRCRFTSITALARRRLADLVTSRAGVH